MRKLNALLISFLALLFASAVHGQTGVNNAALNGNYAFTFTGVSGNGTVSSVFGTVGRFTADGAGNLTNGELDTNTVGGGAIPAGTTTASFMINTSIVLISTSCTISASYNGTTRSATLGVLL